MGNRRRSRELAMQALFQMEANRDDSEEALALFCRHFEVSRRSKDFFLRLVEGVREHRAVIDSLIVRHSDNWKISRMSGVDRNLLRVAVFELLYCEDVPSKVSINEAIDIGKKFGTEHSSAFVNGVLDGIRKELEEGADRLHGE
jgi:N utilization substance protein B